jgi:hypothetical protein
MKQTAVEWLVEQIKNNVHNTIEEFELIVEQSKQMEKEQIINAYEVAYMDGYNDNGKDGKQYYNETFNKDE